MLQQQDKINSRLQFLPPNWACILLHDKPIVYYVVAEQPTLPHILENSTVLLYKLTLNFMHENKLQRFWVPMLHQTAPKRNYISFYQKVQVTASFQLV